MARWQGWRSALTAAVVLVMLTVAFVAGTAGVALLGRPDPLSIILALTWKSSEAGTAPPHAATGSAGT